MTAQLRAERDAALKAARLALADTTRLTRLLSTLTEPGSLDALMDRTVTCLSEIFSADIVALLSPADPQTCAILAACGLPEQMLADGMSSAPPTALAVALGGSACVAGASARADLTVDWRLRDLAVETSMWVPMRTGGAAVVGVVVIGRCSGAAFAATDSALMGLMAGRIGLAIDQAQRSRQLEHLAASTRAIGQSLDERVILEDVIGSVRDVLRAEAAIILLLDADGSSRAFAQNGLTDAEVAAAREPLDSGRDILEEASRLTVGQTLQIADRAALRRPSERAGPLSRLRSLLAAPLIFGGAVQGVLLACRLTVGTFEPGTVQLATLYATQIAAALENARLLHAVRTSDDRFRALIRGVSEVIAILDGDGIIHYASPATQATWGCASGVLLGRSFFERVHPDDVVAARDLLERVQIRAGAVLSGGLRIRIVNGRWGDFEVMLSNQLDDPAVAGIITTCHDVTERKAFEVRLAQLAFRDPLSGLANRALFMDRLEHALDRAARSGQQVAVLFADLDKFKRVNDTLGHGAGDAVLIEVAARIKRSLRTQDTAARLGGDEFTVLLEDMPDVSAATALAERVRLALKAPIQLESQDVTVTASIGVALSTPGQKIDELLHRADSAMYRAKNSGKEQFAVL